MIVEATALVMCWNIFEYGDCFLKQLTDTTMGTSTTMMLAIICFSMHKKHVLLPRYKMHMPLFLRCIDDIFVLVLVDGL